MEQTMGKRIAAHRKRMGMTQDALAERLGITAQAVSKWENDQSCPDISMLPRLAEIFQITADELLGITRSNVHEGQVVMPEEAAQAQPEGSGLEIELEGGRRGSLWLAVLVLLVGGLLLAGSFLGWKLTFWGVLWPSALLVFGASGLLSRPSFFRLGCLLFGGYFLLSELALLPSRFLLGKNVVFPLILVLFGLSLLVDALRKPGKSRFRIRHNGAHLANIGKNHFTKGEDSFSCGTSFGENRFAVQLPKLSCGRAEVSFGEVEVDLTDCLQIAEVCDVELSCSFGELILYVPRRCRVEPAVKTAFAEFHVRGTPDPDAASRIRVHGNVSFGEIVVKYV